MVAFCRIVCDTSDNRSPKHHPEDTKAKPAGSPMGRARISQAAGKQVARSQAATAARTFVRDRTEVMGGSLDDVACLSDTVIRISRHDEVVRCIL